MFGIMKAGAEHLRQANARLRAKHGIRELLSGTVVHYRGIPVRLRYHTDVQTHPDNWKLIDGTPDAALRGEDRS